MSDRINKTSICSVLFLDIIDFSKKSDADQIAVKNQFNELVNLGLKDVAQNDRIILDTGDGVAVAHLGSPEEAMFVALTIRDAIMLKNLTDSPPLLVRFGINLGPVRIVSDINGQPNILGDGINVAERIMSFAQANQILVSRSYFEVTSRLTQEFSEMFAFSGLKQDKHVRKHEVYAVRSHNTKTAVTIDAPIPKDQRQAFRQFNVLKKMNWQYLMLSLPIIFALAYLVKIANHTEQPSNKLLALNKGALKSNPIIKPLALPVLNSLNKNKMDHSLMPNETVETIPLSKKTSLALVDNKHSNKNHFIAKDLDNKNLDKNDSSKNNLEKKDVKKNGVALENDAKLIPEKVDASKEKVTKKTAKNKAKAKRQVEALAEADPIQTPIQRTDLETKHKVAKVQIVVQAEQNIDPTTDNTKVKTGWKTFADSVKQGHVRKCSQVEINMNQCH